MVNHARVWTVLALTGSLWCVAAPVFAQARVLVAPSAGAGVVYDDNLLSAPEGQTLADTIVRVTPGLSLSRESAHSYWFGSYSFDAERYQDHTTLTTPLARQTASLFGRAQTAAHTTFAVNGGYDYTTTPQELNATTGLFTGRIRAWRWHAGPEATQAISPTSSIIVSYDLTDDAIAEQRIVTHAADFTLRHEISARDIIRVRPFVREFMFDTGSVGSYGGVLGWTHWLTPFTSLSLDGGPRFVERDSRVRPELDLQLRRLSGYSDLGVTYLRTMTTALGLEGPLDTQRVVASAGYHHPAVVDVTFEGGVYETKQTTTDIRVYRFTADVTRRLNRVLSISALYGLDVQRGRAVLTPLVTAPELLGDEDAAFGLPLPVGTAATNLPVRRNVFMLKLIVSPTIRPTGRPPKTDPPPEALAKETIR
jgi:hypothetical protein